MDNGFEVCLSRLQKAHDEMKWADFRRTGAEEDLPFYKSCVSELSDAWSALIWRVDWSEDMKQLMHKRGTWIHDYNALCMHLWNKPYTWFSRRVPYFEAMLNMTHIYLTERKVPMFYNPTVYGVEGCAYNPDVWEKYVYVDSETSGLDIVPTYVCVTLPFCVDEDTMHDYYLNKKFRRVGLTDEDMEKQFDVWKKDVRPFLVWVNENLTEKKIVKTGLGIEMTTQPLWRSDMNEH